MTVSSTTSRASYAGDGSTLSFAVPFYFLANGDLRVIIRAADGTETEQAETTDYTVSGAGDPAGGEVTFLEAPATGETVVVLRDPALVQETDYVEAEKFPADTHERGLDKLTMIAQRSRDLVGRCPALADSDIDGSGAFRARGNRLTDLGAPTEDSDAARKGYVDAAIASIQLDGSTPPVLASRAAATGATIPLSVAFLILAGYAAAGDGGGALYKRLAAAPAPAQPWHVQSADGAWWEHASTPINVRSLGAIADGATDSLVAFNDSILGAIALERDVYIPAGDYLVTGQILYDHNLVDVGAGHHAPHIVGDGASGTRILCAPGDYTALAVLSSISPGFQGGAISIRDFSIIKPSLDKLGTGLVLENEAFVTVDRVRTVGFGTGIYLVGTISTALRNIMTYGNNIGLWFDEFGGLPCNAITVYNPYISENTEYGIFAHRPASLHICGGSIENNGVVDSTTAFGIRVDHAGFGGMSGVLIENVYFEDNGGRADIYIWHSDDFHCAHNIIGCNFNRFTDRFTINNVVLDIAGTKEVLVNIQGCGFGSSGTYVEDAARKYIASIGPGTYKLHCMGNMYKDPIATDLGLDKPFRVDKDNNVGFFHTPVAGTSSPLQAGGDFSFAKTRGGLMGNLYFDNAAGQFEHFGDGSGGAIILAANPTIGMELAVFPNNTSGAGAAAGTQRSVFVDTSGNVFPGTDNAQTLGAAGNRWSTVHAGTGTIQTSDANRKVIRGRLNAAELRAWERVKPVIYQMADSLAAKGLAARLHAGFVAQEIEAAFAAEGLDATRYALFCRDDLPGGAVYGLRYDQCLVFEIAYLRTRLEGAIHAGDTGIY